MAELKTQPTTASVDAFLAQQPEPRRAECRQVLEMMQAATGEPAEMWGSSIVGFGRHAYTNSARKTLEWPVIGFSPRKNALTLYLMPGFDGVSELMVALGPHSTGKSCLYLKSLANVDLGVLRRLVDASVEGMAAQRIRR